MEDQAYLVSCQVQFGERYRGSATNQLALGPTLHPLHVLDGLRVSCWRGCSSGSNRDAQN